MTISLCMIVKNEENVIERCLQCVKNIFDEIIIVDTGSGDKTKAICSKFTDKIYDFEWVEDFSAARNYAFSKASCEYLFWLDADDVLEECDANKLIALKNQVYSGKTNRLADTYMLKYVVGENADGSVNFEFYRERLVKNCDKAKFRGFIHECIVPFGKIQYCDISIKHRRAHQGNPERNLNIFLSHKSNGEPFDARSTYYYAKEYYYLGKYEKCQQVLAEFLSMSNKYVADVKDGLITMYRCTFFKGNPAPEYLFSVLKEVGGDAEALTLLGEYYFSRKEYVKAEHFLKFALCVDPSNAVGFVFMPYYHLYPVLDLLKLFQITKSDEEYNTFFNIASQKYPEILLYY